jgi:hypothetical protein
MRPLWTSGDLPNCRYERIGNASEPTRLLVADD